MSIEKFTFIKRSVALNSIGVAIVIHLKRVLIFGANLIR